MNKIFFAVLILVSGCVSSKKRVDTLHNYPIIDPNKCPVPIEQLDEELLKARAKELNMRYVDYLHALTNNKIPEIRKQ